MIRVEMILANKRIKEMKNLWHAAARFGGKIAARIQQNAAILPYSRVKHARDQNFEPVEEPTLPVLIPEPERIGAAPYAFHISPQRFL